MNECDVITLHISGDERNESFVDRRFLDKLKKGTCLVNTSRGKIIDEGALIEYIKNNKVGNVAMDVYENEPDINRALLSLDGIFTTCHIAGSSNVAIKNMGISAITGLLDMLNIEPMEN